MFCVSLLQALTRLRPFIKQVHAEASKVGDSSILQIRRDVLRSQSTVFARMLAEEREKTGQEAETIDLVDADPPTLKVFCGYFLDVILIMATNTCTVLS